MLKRNTNIKLQNKKKGQSTVEYIILVAAVIGVILLFLGPNGPFEQAFNNTLTTGTNGMETIAERLEGSRRASPTAN